MLKGYCVGRQVHVVERPSLPDLRRAGSIGSVDHGTCRGYNPNLSPSPDPSPNPPQPEPQP